MGPQGQALFDVDIGRGVGRDTMDLRLQSERDMVVNVHSAPQVDLKEHVEEAFSPLWVVT